VQHGRRRRWPESAAQVKRWRLRSYADIQVFQLTGKRLQSKDARPASLSGFGSPPLRSLNAFTVAFSLSSSSSAAWSLEFVIRSLCAFEHQRNIANCESGMTPCDKSKLNQEQAKTATAAEHQRNISDCQHVWESCDHSGLTTKEATAVAEAEHQHNVSDCMNGYVCDPSQLTPQETSAVARSEHGRNFTDCKKGGQSCDYSKLTQPEVAALGKAEHQRNVSACTKGYGYCDRSRLTPSEASAIPAGAASAPEKERR